MNPAGKRLLLMTTTCTIYTLEVFLELLNCKVRLVHLSRDQCSQIPMFTSKWSTVFCLCPIFGVVPYLTEEELECFKPACAPAQTHVASSFQAAFLPFLLPCLFSGLWLKVACLVVCVVICDTEGIWPLPAKAEQCRRINY